MIILLISIIIILLIAYFITQFILSPVDALIEDLNTITQGDLNHTIRPSRHQDLNRIVSAVTLMVRSVCDSINSLERSEKRYYSLFLQSSDVIILWDGNEVIDANSAAIKLFGWDNDDNSDPDGIIKPDKDRKRTISSIIKSVKTTCTDSPSDCNISIILQNNVLNTLNVGIEHLLLEDRSLDMLHIRDITLQKRISALSQEKDLLYEARNLLSSILDHLPDPTFVIDTSGRVIAWNRAMQVLTGVSSSEIINPGNYVYSVAIYKIKRPILIDLILNPELGDESPYINKEKKGEFYTAELFFENELDKKKYYSLITGPVYDANDRLIGAIESIRDITYIKQNEKSLQDLNDKLILLSSLTRHDIRNKVLIIDGYRVLASEESSTDSIKNMLFLQKRAIEDIERQIDFSREYQEIGMGKPSWHDVREMTDNAIRTIASGIKIIYEISDLEIYADKLIERVFSNLADNSIRHGINLTTIKLSWFEYEKDGYILYEDNRGGIPDEDKENIFLKGYGKNTGLGLFLIREILIITGIQILEDGIFGIGVRFEIHIPSGRYRKGNPD